MPDHARVAPFLNNITIITQSAHRGLPRTSRASGECPRAGSSESSKLKPEPFVQSIGLVVLTQICQDSGQVVG
jgi:hypothetical protein